ncbi:hypothetical protein [Actinomadura sp. HBU206391]|uniref:hypothetical protein n=1 Tax=Actinomadura sp. HBU206391 TaxID=2731692 RepID=UPI00164F7A03|nr:hypothetical protein [Actinomadura sp. HBU206391]MBC6461323.1 hypothetical protein [Actinomadura sp. HBU206391]
MNVALVVLVVAAIVMVVVRVVSTRRRAAVREPAVPTFNVVALGLQGSGKTLLLSSMYHHLQVPSSQSYYLTAPYDQVIALSRSFAQIADTSEDWPPGTAKGEVREYAFSVETQTTGDRHTIFNLGYLEYAGELLTEPQPPGSTLLASLIEHIESAHALIGIIDGYRIRQALNGDLAGQAHLQHGLTAMIAPMMRTSSPVTFVITKWDLLRELEPDENTRLHMVRNLLMASPVFRDLVRLYSAKRVVRLIPVSAVGPEFATLNGNGRIVKRSDGHIRPTNVDVPLSAVIPDVFEQIEYNLDAATLRAALEQARRQAGLGPLESAAALGRFVGQAAGRAIVGALATPAMAALGGPALGLFLASRGDAPDDRLDRQLSAAEERMHQLRIARKRVLRDLQSKVDVLEGRLPSSRLSSE